MRNYYNYTGAENKSTERKRQLILNAVRFVKRMANISALPGQNRYDLGGKLINEIVRRRYLKQIISVLKYGLKNQEKNLINEAVEAICNISKYGKMSLR